MPFWLLPTRDLKGKMKAVAAMLKAIHAQEHLEETQSKANACLAMS